jgi:phosphonate transport system substrate-binding protein
MKGHHVLLCICACLILFSGCLQQESAKKVSLNKREKVKTGLNSETRDDILWFGFDLRLDPNEDVKIYTPFLRYLEERTGRRFRIRFTPNYEATIENLGKGVTQFAAVGALSYVIGKERYGIRYLVSGVNYEGDPKYHAMIVTRPDSRIYSIRNLNGKSFCFGSRMSTQGHLIPRKMLEDVGITFKDLNYYIYTGSHVNAVTALLNGECDAAGIQDTLGEKLTLEGKIKILKVSEPYPSSIIAYNKDVDMETVQAIRSALLAFEPTGKHENLLYEWNKTEMPLGFTLLDEFEIQKVEKLARRYGLIKE